MSISEQMAEIEAFFEEYRLGALFKEDSEKCYEKAYGRYHAILIWNMIFEKESDNEQQEQPRNVLYFKEATSDIASGQILLFVPTYKASLVLLRSAIENILRGCMCTERPSDPIPDSTHELFRQCRGLAVFSVESMKGRMDELTERYKTLCGYVHSSDVTYMVLKIPFRDVLRPNYEEFRLVVGHIEFLASLLNEVFYWYFNMKLDETPHRYADYVLDRLRPALKRAVREGS